MTAKLANAIARSRRVGELSRTVCVGLSGGKDSLCTLDVVCRSAAFDHVECLAMYIVRGLESFEVPVLRAAERYGVPIRWVPHPMVSGFLSRSTLRMHSAQTKSYKLKDVEAYVTSQGGPEWFAYGDRSSDSIARHAITKQCDGVKVEWCRLWPIWDWKDRDVYGYIKHRRLRPAHRWQQSRSSGLTLEGRDLSALKKAFPNDYRKIIEAFPFAEIQVVRYERGDFDAPAKL